MKRRQPESVFLREYSNKWVDKTANQQGQLKQNSHIISIYHSTALLQARLPTDKKIHNYLGENLTQSINK